MPWRDLRVPVELESTCGANLGWGRAEEGRKREKRKKKPIETVPLWSGSSAVVWAGASVRSYDHSPFNVRGKKKLK